MSHSQHPKRSRDIPQQDDLATKRLKEDNDRLRIAVARHLLETPNVRAFLTEHLPDTLVQELDTSGQLAYSWNHLEQGVLKYGVCAYLDNTDFIQVQQVSRLYRAHSRLNESAGLSRILNVDKMLNEWHTYLRCKGRRIDVHTRQSQFYMLNRSAFDTPTHWVIKKSALTKVIKFLTSTALGDGFLSRVSKISVCFTSGQYHWVRSLLSRCPNLRHLRLCLRRSISGESLVNNRMVKLKLQSLWILCQNRELLDSFRVVNLARTLTEDNSLEEMVGHSTFRLGRTELISAGMKWLGRPEGLNKSHLQMKWLKTVEGKSSNPVMESELRRVYRWLEM
jgi:hypothetical protein